MSSWLSDSLAKAEQLLEQVDRSAGEKIEKVRERAGIHHRPANGTDDGGEPSSAAPLPHMAPPPASEATAPASDLDAPEGSGVEARPKAGPAGRAVHPPSPPPAERTPLRVEAACCKGVAATERTLKAEATAEYSRAPEARGARSTPYTGAEPGERSPRVARGPAHAAADDSRGSGRERFELAAANERVAALQLELAAAKKAEAEAAQREQLHLESLAAVEQAAAMEQALAERQQAALLSRVVAAEQREAELVLRNQELAAALGGGSRQLEETTLAAKGAEGAVARLEAELARAREQRQQSDASLSAARREVSALKGECEALAKQLDSAQAGRRAAERGLKEAQESITELQARAEAARSESKHVTAGEIHSATATAAAAAAAEQLAERSHQIQKLMSERTALRYQLENETRRRVSVEAQLQHSTQPRDHARTDVLYSTGRSKENGGRLPKLVELVQTNVARPRPALMQCAQRADDLAQLLDQLTLQAGRVMRQFPVLRLAVVSYAILLHSWLFVLLMSMAPEGKRSSHK
ncbi:hypothetical protein AB1Y20_019263 [Prymnesium parvum]|uniref:Golgin-84 n=1 Tax=Prymnesium parvum TaxID=97485 RepID=A0AB34JTT1_PRYPA